MGIKDNVMLSMFVNGGSQRQTGTTGDNSRARQGSQQPNGTSRPLPNTDQIEDMRLKALADPYGQSRLNELNPNLAAALHDKDRWRETLLQMYRQQDERSREEEEQRRILMSDPFDIDAQRKIEELIRQDNVLNNLQYAMEHNPEVFGRVTMLYINTEVNGFPVKAFVDSGAQATIMSASCAEKCGIMRLIDKRYSGIAKGVGTAKILGRVHSAEIKIGDAELLCAFTVMEGKDVDLLFGLDMLKRYQACIDLQNNVLRFPGNEVPFLPESEIPKNMMEEELNEPTVSGPNGTEIGAKTGAVKPAGAPHSSVAIGPSGPTSNFRGSGQTLGAVPSAASGNPAQSSRPVAQQPQRPSFPQASIDQLVGMGFDRADAIQALAACDGNVELAAGLLLG
ncbi:MAG: DNA damage-inducible protein 1 [Bogoriella megaspora]|nr:MAG: DNA damage-inducible protein 1 [Bogoriella megaspora]